MGTCMPHISADLQAQPLHRWSAIQRCPQLRCTPLRKRAHTLSDGHSQSADSASRRVRSQQLPRVNHITTAHASPRDPLLQGWGQDLGRSRIDCVRGPSGLSNLNSGDAGTSVVPGEAAPQLRPAQAPAVPGGADVQEEQAKRRKLWLAALKPPLYSVAVAPVMVGAATAFAEKGEFYADRFGCLLLGAILVIAWLNLSNDGFDAATGVDKNKAESVVNLTGGRAGPILAVSFALLAVGAWLLYLGFSPAEDERVGLALAVAVVLGYMYQGPPFRLSYKGWGEAICFLTFGPLATLAFHLAMAGPQGTVGPAAATCSVLTGSSIASILFCSHFHQIEGDLAAGKASPLTRLGLEKGLQVLEWWVLGTEALGLAAAGAGLLPWTAVPALLLVLPLGLNLGAYAKKHMEDLEQLRFLKLQAVKWQMALSVGLATSLVVARLLPEHPLPALL